MSGARNRAWGRQAELAVANHLRDIDMFPYAEPRPSGSPNPYGDIANLGPGLVIEVKAEKQWRPAAYLRQLADEMDAMDAAMGLVAVKPKGVGMSRVGDWFSLRPLALDLDLLRVAGWGNPRSRGGLERDGSAVAALESRPGNTPSPEPS